jgi:hypothetical protein
MNELTSNLTIQNPQQAVEEYMGEQFIEWLMNYIAHKVKNWPIMDKIRTAKPKPEKLRKFMIQVFLAQEAFLGSREGDPGFLRFAIANLSEVDDPVAESALEILEKRRQDELIGHQMDKGILKTVKREQWMKLLRSLEISQEEIDRSEPKEPTRNYIAELSDVYSSSEWQTAIGAFASNEQAVIEEYRAILAMIKNNLPLPDRDLAALINYIAGENQYVVNTNHVLDKIVFDRETKDLVWQGVEQSLAIREEFLTGLGKYLES